MTNNKRTELEAMGEYIIVLLSRPMDSLNLNTLKIIAINRQQLRINRQQLAINRQQQQQKDK